MNDRRIGLGHDTLLRVDAYDGMTVAQARSLLRHELERRGCAEPSEDARRLAAHAVGVSPSRLTLEGSRVLSLGEARRLHDYERQRLKGRTVGRIVGQRPFHDITLGVSDAVLEPRDDTAALVELALPHLHAACERGGSARLLDCGVGAGTVTFALLAAEPRARAVGIDVSAPALALSKTNAERLGLADRFEAREADMLGDTINHSFDVPFDVIVSNPPYIPSADVDALEGDARLDPRAALDGGPDGLRFYRALSRLGRTQLAPDGVLAVEIGAGQGADVRAIMASGGWNEAGAMIDLGGHERALAFSREAADGTDGRG